ncbi:MAG: LD-carboxypeptidase [Flavobacteriaceae bacterium]|nr:MAG: LD-carboxypeptidase [Flavobacteriaceae bacterium]
MLLSMCIVLSVQCQGVSQGTPEKLQETSVKKMISDALVRPPYLKKGDTIALLSPAGILRSKKDVITKAIKVMESWGLHVVIGENMYNQNHHFAGTDAQRTQDFQEALDNPSIKAIWTARGGYGTVRILDGLDYTKFIKKPKWIIGYSDITALHNQIHNLGFETIHGMMAVNFGTKPALISETIATFKKAVFGEDLKYTLPASTYNREGKAQGQLVGGNLTLLHCMLGSKTSLDTTDKILFIEEVGEYVYHVDRMLQSLKRAGYFKHVKGVIMGDISRIRKNPTPFGKTVEEVVLDNLKGLNIPVAFGMPAGHKDKNVALILGRKVTMTVSKQGSKVVFED